MIARRSVKAEAATPQIAGVIFSSADLQRALRMRHPPDLFELRLDALAAQMDKVEITIRELRAPLIITARHPHEGGVNDLSVQERRALLARAFPHAAYVDIELRSVRAFAPLLKKARTEKIGMIISFHDLREMPGTVQLDEIARAAHSLGADVLKIAARTDTPAQLARLMEFFLRTRSEMKIAAMGIGRLGRQSRLAFAKCGTVLNYVHLGTPQVAGQLSIGQLRRIVG